MFTKRIPLTLVEPDPSNRSVGKIPELADGIKQCGLLHPPVIRPNPKKPGFYVVIAGHRRLAAILMLGWKEADFSVIEEGDIHLIRLAENINREELAPWQIAEQIDALRSQGRSIADIAAATGKSVSHVSGYARLKPNLCDEAWELFKSQGRKAKIGEWLTIPQLTPENQRERLFGDRVKPRQKRARVTRNQVAGKLRQLQEGDKRAPVLRWFLGEIPWKDTDK